jgi:hypothetical protein
VLAAAVIGVLLVVFNKSSGAELKHAPFIGMHLSETHTPQEFDALMDYTFDGSVIFLDITDPFPTEFGKLVGPYGKTLLVYWETRTTLEPIYDGSFDRLIKKFVDETAAYGYPVMMIPLHEMNLYEDGAPSWGYSEVNTPQLFVATWRKLHDMFGSLPNVTWGIDYNDDSIPSEEEAPDNSYEAFYPGDAYVDYVGVSAFNWLSYWQPFSEVVGPQVERLAQFGKPIYIFGTACGEDSFKKPYGSRKAEWITGMFTYLHEHQEIEGLMWFNENKEEVWPVDPRVDPLTGKEVASELAYKAFKQGLQGFKPL